MDRGHFQIEKGPTRFDKARTVSGDAPSSIFITRCGDVYLAIKAGAYEVVKNPCDDHFVIAAARLVKHYRQYEKFVAADQRFHQLIIESAGNRVTSDTCRGMNAILFQARLYPAVKRKERAGEVGDGHARILRAFEEGDGVEAARAIKEHLEGEGKRRLLTGKE